MQPLRLLPVCLLTLALVLNGRGRAAGPADLPLWSVRAGLPHVFAKLDRGDAVRIAYLGGSITAQPGWRPKTLAWFQQTFPAAKVSEINAAIGGTGSDLGVFRLQHDVLSHQPDLLLVEFAVNDGGAPPAQIHRAMEGIVRQTWQAGATIDIAFVYTIAGDMLATLKRGEQPRSVAAMEEIAAWYAIPSVNFGVEVAREESAGRLRFEGPLPRTEAEKAAAGDRLVFSPDGVHPYPETGHELYRRVAVAAFEAMRSVGGSGLHELKAPRVPDHLAAAKMIPLSRVRRSAGWDQLTATNRLVQSFGQRLPELWRANQPGERLTFRFRGTTAGVYDLVGPDCGQVIVRLDDRPPVTVPRFDAFCTYHRLASFFALRDAPEATHDVVLELHPDQPDKRTILARRQEKMDDPKRYDDRAWYAGALLLVGDLID